MNGLLICDGLQKDGIIKKIMMPLVNWLYKGQVGATKNMGDFMQSVACEQFSDKWDCLVDRESLHQFKSNEKTQVVMNAWFMHNPDHFPPSEDIVPLYVSFHITPSVADRMLTEEVIEHLKKHAPIGARDIATRDLLLSKGIESYFSGCLTLTLGKKYKSDKPKNNKIIFVDPYFDCHGVDGTKGVAKRIKAFSIKKTLCAFSLYRKHYNKVKQLKGFNTEFKSALFYIFPSFDQKLAAACFYDTYSRLFADSLLFEAEFIQHRVAQSAFKSTEEKFEWCRNKLKEYASCKLVITSRIHCALPCLGVEAPVIFINSEDMENGSVRGAGRFGGNLELFHSFLLKKDGSFETSDEYLLNVVKTGLGKIGVNSSISNKEDYKVLRDKMSSLVTSFYNR